MLKVKALIRLTIGPVDLTVADGECVAITGPSGTGKSVFLRAIVDLDPNEGQISVGKISRENTPAPEWRSHVAMLPAESGWWDDNVGAHFKNPNKITPQLTDIGLANTAMEWEVARLSSGEKHRLALLRCLENDPEVLLLDEPTAALDHDTTLMVEALLRKELERGTSIVIVTHDAAQATRLADRRLHLEDGKLGEVAP